MTNKQVAVLAGTIFSGCVFIATAIMKGEVKVNVIRSAKEIYAWLKEKD